MAGMKRNRKRQTGGKPARRQAYPIDAAWKAEVRRLMEERGLSQARLATQIGVVPSAIVFLFERSTKSSRMVPAIHEALGLLPPVAPPATQAIRAA